MTKVTDSFDRADSTTVGASWTELVGDWAIVSNQCECNDDGGSTGYYLRNDTTVGSNDMYAQAVTNSTQANSSSNTGVLCRGQTGATNTSYQFTTNHAADSWSLWRITAGSETQILTGSTPIASGDTVRLETAGSILRGKINGTLVALARDTTTSGGTRGGLNGYNAVGTDVVRVNDFETGAIADSPPGGPYVNGWSAQSSGTGTTQAPGVPANSIADGVCVLAWITSKDAAETVSAPAGEGWVLVENPSQTGLEGYLFAKIWGLGGQTDSSTPTFTIGSGAAGWLTTLQLVRNPDHATSPWTSVASAIVASGSSSNAAASTVSAPSVSVSGSHLTVIRFYGSADDNALGGAISAGAGVLSFSGAPYDQVTGGGIAQASTVLEDVTIGSSTGTATVTETVAGNDISHGVTVVFAIPSAATVDATMSAPLGGLASALAVPTVNATGAGSLGGSATATAVRTVNPTLTGSFGGTAAALALPTVNATFAGSLGGSATATAVTQRAASAAAALGGSAALSAVTQRSATGSAALGGVGAATAAVSHAGTATAPLGFNADAFAVAGNVVQATADASFTGTASATALPTVIAQAIAGLGGSASASAIAQHEAVLAAAFGGAATATGRVQHNALLAGLFGFTATATAGVLRNDPNPYRLAIGDAAGVTFTEAASVLTQEEVAA